MARSDLWQSFPSEHHWKVAVLVVSVDMLSSAQIFTPKQCSDFRTLPSATEPTTTSVFHLDHVCIVALMPEVEMATEEGLFNSVQQQ